MHIDTILSPPRRAPLLSALLSSLALASPAFADDIAPAESLFNRGKADMDAGRYETGCKAIAESQRLDPRPGTLFTLAVCETQWGRIATAVTHYGDYLSLYDRMTPDQKSRQGDRPKEAKAKRGALGPQVPELTLALPPGAPARTVVTRDGAVMSESALGMGLPVDPGEHIVTTQAPGGSVWEQRITINKGEKKALTLEVKPAPEVEPPASKETKGAALDLKVGPKVEPPKGDQGPSGRRKAAYVAGGVGLAGLVLGGVMGGLTLGQKGVIGDHCGKAARAKDDIGCDPTGIKAVNSARTLGLVSTIGFIVGGAGLGLGTVLFVTAPRPPKGVAPRAESGRWMRAGVLEAGNAGVVLGGWGAW